ncbi:hypothetical protein, partial [Pseudomonas savastanoi]|uniref:hypothetical protein n=1 Tax=Pseudomonas savastanoi TaxID=29438 RepID=UPI001CC218DE
FALAFARLTHLLCLPPDAIGSLCGWGIDSDAGYHHRSLNLTICSRRLPTSNHRLVVKSTVDFSLTWKG